MKKIFLKIIFAVMLGICSLFLTCIGSYAASAGISASNTKVNVGDSVNINVTANAVTWNLKVSGSGLSDSIVGVNSNAENETINKSYKLDTSKAGTYTITLSGDVTDSQGTKTISSTATVTVEEKKAEQPKEEEKKDEENKTEEQKPVEPVFKDVNETVYVSTDSVNVRSTYSSNGGKYGTLKKGDSVTRTGICTETINGYTWSRIKYNGNTAYVISSSLTTVKPEEKEEEKEEEKKEEKSSSKSLSSLTIVGYELTPKFDPETRTYSLTLDEDDDDDELDITAIPEDEKAKVTIVGNENFKVGNNIVKITVTAEDGTTRMYSITVSKTNESGVVDSLKLDKLQVLNVTLEPSFDPDITNYTIRVEDPSTIKTSDIIATSSDKNVKVTIAENEQLDNKEKIITIMLEDSKNSKTGVYQISVKKPVENQMATVEGNNDNSIYYILGSIIGVLLFLIVIIIIVLRKTSNKNDEYDSVKRNHELDDDYSKKTDANDYDSDEIIQQSNSKSQILNDNVEILKDDDAIISNNENLNNAKGSTTVFNSLDLSNENMQNNNDDDTSDFEQRKKGKHF